MFLSLLAIILGLVVLVWSADRFIAGASNAARYLGMPPLLIGMLIVGFGTSAPEIAVSIIAAYQGNPAMALGNAYGSNITNIGLILGLSALVLPIRVNSKVLRMELPILTGVTFLSAFLLMDQSLDRSDAQIMLVLMLLLVVWSHWHGLRDKDDSLGSEVQQELDENAMGKLQSFGWLIAGLLLLVGSSRLLVWGAVGIATQLGVSDLLIGLTIVAVGTSLPELAATIVATRKGEHDMAIGNIIGSNLFNTLGVVGVCGVIRPFDIGADVVLRDMPVMLALTVSLFIIGFAFRGAGKGRVNRWEGSLLLCAYVCYNAWLVMGVLG